ncbi:MAG: radical SAM protein, partial [Moorellales bacterium]
MRIARIALAQVDGKWPNLALMCIAAYHRRLGHEVEWFNPLFAREYDAIYASKIFNFTPDNLYLPPDAVRGGTGYDLHSALPPEVEACFPDYSLYDLDYAIGFTTRGCPRRCPFCVVPRKEGTLRVVGDLYSFWKPETGFTKVRLLDNNLTAAPWEHFRLVIEQLASNRLLVDISQGLDARLMTDDHARLLAKVRLWKQ